jgi:hypothetical protein
VKLYAVPGHHNVIDTIVDATGLTSINGETFEQVRERYPLARLYTWGYDVARLHQSGRRAAGDSGDGRSDVGGVARLDEGRSA